MAGRNFPVQVLFVGDDDRLVDNRRMDLFPLSRSLPRLLEGRGTTTLAERLGVSGATLAAWRRRPPKMFQKLEALVRLCGYRTILVPFERGSHEAPDLEALFARVEELESIVRNLEKMFDLTEERP